MNTLKELLYRLNTTDETANIEAKRGTSIDRSIMETACAFANEPGLDGGYIILGIVKDESTLFPEYTLEGVADADKLQLDFTSQCAGVFNTPIRPTVEIEEYNGKIGLIIYVPELPPAQKPVYFKHEHLPRGAYRRIGSSDQRCTDDDLCVFFNREDTLDSSIVKESTTADLDDNAIETYRELRSKVNPYAGELSFKNLDLLAALGCLKTDFGKHVLTYAGLLVFGNKFALRRLLPMVRVDYIRVPGNEWVSDPEIRFTTLDMRGSLIELVQRAFNVVSDDMPKGFLLPEGQLQAETIGLPTKVLREALVNAFIHRTYRENQPIQIIRYGNRIEIRNPGFSLKPEEQLGEPGSKNRNPYIAAIFHETNLAETKGSGIRTMRILMEEAGMAPPTFESDHTSNTFTIRLLLHHFLSKEDLDWLSLFADYDLTDAQKRGLIFVRETGAIDNQAYRQLNGCDIIKASGELRALRYIKLLEQKGKSRATYYVPSEDFDLRRKAPVVDHSSLPNQLDGLSNQFADLSNQFPALANHPDKLELFSSLPDDLREKIQGIGRRTSDKDGIRAVIIDLCNWRELSLYEISILLGRGEKHLLYNYVTPLREEGKIVYTIPDMPNHPHQAYKGCKTNYSEDMSI